MLFINFSNHSSKQWSKEQIAAVHAMGCDEIIDDPFPQVLPEESHMGIKCMALGVVHDYEDVYGFKSIGAVMCQGEFSLTYEVTRLLKEAGVKVVVACSDRKSEEIQQSDGSVRKVSTFKFVQFREV